MCDPGCPAPYPIFIIAEGDDGRVVLVGQCEQQLVRCHAGGERIALSERNAEPLKAFDIFAPVDPFGNDLGTHFLRHDGEAVNDAAPRSLRAASSISVGWSFRVPKSRLARRLRLSMARPTSLVAKTTPASRSERMLARNASLCVVLRFPVSSILKWPGSIRVLFEQFEERLANPGWENWVSPVFDIDL